MSEDLPSATNVNSARDKLNGDFQSLVSHAEDLLNATTSLSSEGVSLARQKLGETLSQVKSQLGPARDAAMQHSKAAVNGAVNFARERPWQTAAIVALAALAMGFLVSLGRDE